MRINLIILNILALIGALTSSELFGNPTMGQNFNFPLSTVHPQIKHTNTQSQQPIKGARRKSPSGAYKRTPTTPFEKGCRYFWSREYDKALAHYASFIASQNQLDEANKIKEKLSLAHYNIAHIYMMKGSFKLAIENFVNAYSFPEATNKTDILVGLGDAYLEDDSHLNALEIYYEALRHPSEDKKKISILWSKIGKALFLSKNYNNACSAFEKSYEIDPVSSEKTIEVLDYLHVLYDHRATFDQSGNTLIYQGYSENYLILGELMRAGIDCSALFLVNP